MTVDADTPLEQRRQPAATHAATLRADLRSRLINDIALVWPAWLRFLSSRELVDRLVAHRPQLWGTVTAGRPLTMKRLDAILRPYPAAAGTIRRDGIRGRYRSPAVDALLATIPDDATQPAPPAPQDAVVSLPGWALSAELLARLAAGATCRIEPIRHGLPTDPAVMFAFRVTILDERGTLGL